MFHLNTNSPFHAFDGLRKKKKPEAQKDAFIYSPVDFLTDGICRWSPSEGGAKGVNPFICHVAKTELNLSLWFWNVSQNVLCVSATTDSQKDMN